jgi:hypothetical protein
MLVVKSHRHNAKCEETMMFGRGPFFEQVWFRDKLDALSDTIKLAQPGSAWLNQSPGCQHSARVYRPHNSRPKAEIGVSLFVSSNSANATHIHLNSIECCSFILKVPYL